MKIIGTGSYDANVTTTTTSLANALLTKPEISVNITNLFEKQFASFSSYLARRGMVKTPLPDFSSPNFKTIGNRKFMWPLKGHPFRKGTFTAAAVNSKGGANIGVGNQVFTITTDTNFFNPNSILELGDRKTLIATMDEYPTEVGTNQWEYKCKYVTKSTTSFVPAALLAVGEEVGFSHTIFPEMSETGYESNTFPEWHTNYMTIQRMAHSISGSAQKTVLWLEHNGQKIWTTHQDLAMMERWAYARENQLIFGRGTIDANDNVYMKDLKSRDLVAGDGLLASATGSLKFQYQKLTVKVLERVMQNLQLLANSDGMVEIFAFGGQAFNWDFQRLMRDVFKYNPVPLFQDGKGGKGVDATFVWYQVGGVKIITAWNTSADAAGRPQSKDVWGVNKDSRRAIFCSMGNTIGGDPNVELVTLGGGGGDRSFVKRVITGMAAPGEASKDGRASNSMDGYQVQVLSETGMCLKNPYGVAELYVP